MPQLGESVTEGKISKWLVSPGEIVQKYDPIAEVLTDKVSAEIPSSFSGVIKELVAKEEEVLAVGEVICTIAVEKSSSTVSVNAAPQPQVEELSKPINMAGRYSPAVLKLAEEHNIPLASIHGTGKGGRITRKDLQQYIESKETNKADIPTVFEETRTTAMHGNDIEIPITNVRKTIATRMQKSKQEAPHAWMMVEVDATNLVKLRNSLKGDFLKKEGYSITYFAFFIKAVAQALTEFPQMNAMWSGDKIIQKKDINISIAVATDDALFVPVIKNADEKTIKAIAREIDALAGKVRSGKLKQDDMDGGTFTVNNTGTFGSVQSMGIINPPQAAILQVEAIVKRPVVIDDMIAIRSMVNLCLSIDHRVLDGLISGRFMARVKEIIEGMSQANTSIY